MRNNFYSFSDAFREANRKQKIEYFTSEQEQAQLTATRRQFRSFLIALDIEYGLLKDPEEKSKFDNSKEKSESTSETQLLEWLFDLGAHLANSDDVPPIPRTVSSQELYDSLFGAMDAKEDKALLGEVNTELP